MERQGNKLEQGPGDWATAMPTWHSKHSFSSQPMGGLRAVVLQMQDPHILWHSKAPGGQDAIPGPPTQARSSTNTPYRHTAAQPQPKRPLWVFPTSQACSSPQREVALYLTDKELGGCKKCQLECSELLRSEPRCLGLFPLKHLMGRGCLEQQNQDPPQPASSLRW